MHEVTGWAAEVPGAPLAPRAIGRRDPRDVDVVVRITYCGICATDLHAAAHGAPETFPLVPGHEMVGEVTEVGSAVTAFAPGQKVAVGNVVDSCRVCEPCRAGYEQMCAEFPTLTYGGVDRVSGGTTQGGFSREIVVDEHFVYEAPAGLDPAATAPLLCAGVTTWSPLRRFGAGPGTTVGVIGVGGLGHMGIKFAHALGAETVAFTSTEAKAGAARGLGADDVVVTSDDKQMDAARGRFDLILDTTGAALDYAPYLAALRLRGTLAVAGIATEPLRIEPFSLTYGEHVVAGTGSAGVATTREMLAFCGEHGIAADVETVPVDGINEAMARLARGDVRFRFSVDVTA